MKLTHTKYLNIKKIINTSVCKDDIILAHGILNGCKLIDKQQKLRYGFLQKLINNKLKYKL